MASKEYRYEFTVESAHDMFPIDMLRYDCCWPKSESKDSVAITVSLDSRAFRLRHVPQSITLVGLREPTAGRWESFGWKVTSQRKITLI